MPLPKNRSNSVRKVHVRIRSGNTIHYSRKRVGHRHSCALTGNPLQAVSSTRSKGTKPNRKFGGSLSSAAASRVIVIASRVKEGAMKLSEVDLTMLPYVKRMLTSKK